jgi:hypothetical protein
MFSSIVATTSQGLAAVKIGNGDEEEDHRRTEENEIAHDLLLRLPRVHFTHVNPP